MSENDKKLELLKKAFEYKAKENYQEAIECLKEALKISENPDENVEILTQIGDISFVLKDYNEALKHYQKALFINGENQTCIQRCFDIYFLLEQYQKALNLAQKICENNKNSISYFNYFKTLYKLDKKQDIIEIFNTLDEDIKLDVNVLYIISLVDDDKREALLKRIVEIDDSFEPANLDLAQIMLERKEYEEVYRYCINLDTNIPFVSYCLAKVNYNRKNINRAIEYLKNAIKYDNNNHDYCFDLAKIYVDITYFEEALACLKYSINYSLINNNKENLDEKYFLCGWILYKKNEFDRALLNLNLVTTNSSFYPDAKILIEVIASKNTAGLKVVNELEELYKNSASNPILIDTLASIYKNLNMTKKAIIVYSKALEKYPDSIFYKLELTDLYIDIKEYNNAMTLIESIALNTKNCVNIYNSLARIYFRLKDYQRALESINQYIVLDKNNAESYYFKGLILNEMKDFKNAKSAIYYAINLNPNNAKYYSQMARSYYNFGEFKEALLYIKEAIEIDPNDINYKKQGYEIAQKIGDKNVVMLYENQLKASEKILKNLRK